MTLPFGRNRDRSESVADVGDEKNVPVAVGVENAYNSPRRFDRVGYEIGLPLTSARQLDRGFESNYFLQCRDKLLR